MIKLSSGDKVKLKSHMSDSKQNLELGVRGVVIDFSQDHQVHPNGSVLVVWEKYQYRENWWVDLSTLTFAVPPKLENK